MAEILAGNGVKRAFKELEIEARRLYKGTQEPYYEVWELSRHDLGTIEYTVWQNGWGWFSNSKGSRLGTACSFFTVNKQFLIGWDTGKKKETYDKLSDYLADLGLNSHDDICAAANDLARYNGKSLADLFKTYEG